MNHSTFQQPEQNKVLDKTAPNFSALDKLFITLTAAGFIGGTSLTILLCSSWVVVPIVPASFFGLGISSLVYHFMGGIKSDTKFQVGAIKVTGTLAGLIATICLLNSVFVEQLEQRIKVTSLSIDPDGNSLLAVKRDTGEAIQVNVVANGILKQKTIAVPDTLVLNNLKDLCRQGKGFCEEPDLPAEFQIDNALPLGEAKVCSDRSKFVGYPLIIKSNRTKQADLVQVNGTDIYCENPDDKPIQIRISPQNAEGFLGRKVVVGKGTATIPSLKNLPIKAAPLLPSANLAQTFF